MQHAIRPEFNFNRAIEGNASQSVTGISLIIAEYALVICYSL
jgi:hypothetical protein